MTIKKKIVSYVLEDKKKAAESRAASQGVTLSTYVNNLIDADLKKMKKS